MTSNKERPTIRRQARQIIGRVIEFFDREKHTGCYQYPISNATKRAAAATGASEATICKIRKEVVMAKIKYKKLSTPGKTRQESTRKIVMDDFALCTVRRTIHKFYTVKKQIPTLRSLLVELRNEINFKGGRETLRRMIHNLGFRFKKCKNKKIILTERKEIIAWRARYLRRIRSIDSCDDKRPVIFLGETLFHPTYIIDKFLRKPKTKGVLKKDTAGPRWIILHAGWGKGFIPGAFFTFKCKTVIGDYRNELNSEKFSKWVKEKLLPNLPEKSLVVMNHTPCHSVQDNKPPTTAYGKAEIQKWLEKNEIRFSDDMMKSELLELVRSQKPSPTYKIDKLFKEKGHDVIRLPPYHCNLNAIEYVWNVVKEQVARLNVDQNASGIKKIIENIISSVSESDWEKAVENVKKEEAAYWVTDSLMENEIESILLRGEESDTDIDNDSECSAAGLSDCQSSDEYSEEYDESSCQSGPPFELVECGEDPTMGYEQPELSRQDSVSEGILEKHETKHTKKGPKDKSKKRKRKEQKQTKTRNGDVTDQNGNEETLSSVDVFRLKKEMQKALNKKSCPEVSCGDGAVASTSRRSEQFAEVLIKEEITLIDTTMVNVYGEEEELPVAKIKHENFPVAEECNPLDAANTEEN